MTVVVGAPEDFTLEAFRRVTVDGEGVVIGPAALRVMGEARAGFERLLRADPRGFIYGVTTRPGVEVGTAIPPEDLRDYARRFRGVGRGFGRDCLDERVVRGIVFARLADFIGGHAKVRPELAQRVAALLDGPLPRVPLDGQGGAGEILPLMHVMAAVDCGDLVEGEGMALINGSPCATALAADVALPASQGHPFGRVLSTGGFHNGAAAPAINWLTASWADLALVAQRQVTAMHSPTSGLPHLLAPAGFVPGASGGATNPFGWVATGLVEEARALAAPTLLPATINDTQNDIATPTFGAYRSQHRAAECLDSVLAILALVSSQALSVTSRHPAPPLAGLLNGIRSVFPPVQAERDGQGTQAEELTAIFSRAALTGQLD